MKIGISQPTFLPWHGYFALIDYVDIFVFLDTVQFVKRSWIQRNKIKNGDKEQWITIPIKTKHRRYQTIKDTKIDFTHLNKKKIINTIFNNYNKTSHFEKYFHMLEEIILNADENLTNLNLSLITKISEALNIRTKFVKSSDISNCDKLKNVELLRQICINMSASEYISTIGSKDYMGEKSFFEDTDIKIKFYDYKTSKYNQIGKNFLPYLSIIDLLFNEGINSTKILKKNFNIL